MLCGLEQTGRGGHTCREVGSNLLTRQIWQRSMLTIKQKSKLN